MSAGRGSPRRPQGRTRPPARQRAADTDRERTDSLRGRARRRRHRQREGYTVAHRAHGPVLRSAGHRTDGGGFGAAVTLIWCRAGSDAAPDLSLTSG
jgi:hypothetical protein